MRNAVFSAVVILTWVAPLTHAASDADLSRKILGSWLYKKIETYKANGTWILWDPKVEPTRPVPGQFSWHIKNGHLIRVRDGNTFDDIITELTAEKVVLTSTEGGQAVYERVKTPR